LKLSVIILNYNVRYFLEQCLLSVRQAISGLDAEIIVVDNNSTDQSVEMLQDKYPEILLIANKDNLGFSKGNNIGVKRAQGEFICILNPDTVLPEDALSHCMQFAESNPEMGILGIQYRDGTGHFLPECKRNLPTPVRSILKILGLAFGNNGYYAKQLDVNALGKVEILAGAFMFMRKSLYDEVGGFDEDYFMYGEDIDLSYKVQKTGASNYYNGLVKMLHYKGESTLKDKAYFDRFYGAMTIFYKKHFSQNPFLNTLVKSGVFITRQFQSKVRTGASTGFEADEVWVFTEDLQLLRSISLAYEIPVKSVAIRLVEEDFVEGKILVFDANFLSFKSIIELMAKQKNGGNSFRIRPPRCNFIIGSDFSDQKGEVMLLD